MNGDRCESPAKPSKREEEGHKHRLMTVADIDHLRQQYAAEQEAKQRAERCGPAQVESTPCTDQKKTREELQRAGRWNFPGKAATSPERPAKPCESPRITERKEDGHKHPLMTLADIEKLRQQYAAEQKAKQRAERCDTAFCSTTNRLPLARGAAVQQRRTEVRRSPRATKLQCCPILVARCVVMRVYLYVPAIS